MERVDSLRVYRKSVANFKPIVKGYQAVCIDLIASIKANYRQEIREFY